MTSGVARRIQPAAQRAATARASCAAGRGQRRRLEGPPQEFPPTNTTRVAWPDRLALSPDGKQLLIPLNLVDHAAIVDTASGAIRYVAVGHYPYAAAILPNGKTGLVTTRHRTVSVIDLKAGTKTRDITVGTNLSHPRRSSSTGRDQGVRHDHELRQARGDQPGDSTVEATLIWSIQPAGAAPVALTLSPDAAGSSSLRRASTTWSSSPSRRRTARPDSR